MKRYLTVLGLVIATALSGCKSVYNVRRAAPDEVSQEGTVVFVRPTDYTLFGTKSMRDYLEIVNERASKNDAGLLQVQVGFRNRGGRHLWDTKGPNISLSVKTAFYDQPFVSDGQKDIPVYETNWETLPMPRGDTVEYKAVCPKPSGAYYQVTVSEILK